MEHPSKKELHNFLGSLREVKEHIQTDHATDHLHSIINGIVVIAMLLTTFLYPLLTKSFNSYFYVASWIATVIFMYMHITLMIKGLLRFVNYNAVSMMEKSIEDNIEQLRQKEYAELTGKNRTDNSDTDLQSIEQPDLRSGKETI
jgi:cobalamin biosynthesis protein CobD/CbiB